MEDALVLETFDIHRIIKSCLNPCFNGRCTRTVPAITFEGTSYEVLILVLMEDALVLYLYEMNLKNLDSLNPCFNGRCTRTD